MLFAPALPGAVIGGKRSDRVSKLGERVRIDFGFVEKRREELARRHERALRLRRTAGKPRGQASAA
jgi:hypothetical protein